MISITPDFKIVISEELIGNILEESTLDYIKQFDGKDIHLPNRFVPSKDLLDIHHQKVSIEYLENFHFFRVVGVFAMGQTNGRYLIICINQP